MFEKLRYVDKANKGLYVIEVDNIERVFCIVKVRKEHMCIVTNGIIKPKDQAYVIMPVPNKYISIIGMHILRNNLKPEIEDFIAKYICENMDKVYEYIDLNKDF